MTFKNTLRVAGIAAVAGLALTLAGCGSKGSTSTVAGDDMTMGPASAKVTVIEYASVACPLCAEFNGSVMPQLKAKYIDPGKIRYVYRPMLTGVPTIAAAGQLLAQCAGKDKYFKVVDAIMAGQKEFYAQGENDTLARPVLLRIAASVGLSEADFNKCVTDTKALEHLNDLNAKYGKDDGIDGTPTFFINGKKLVRTKGDITDFDGPIAAAQAAAK